MQSICQSYGKQCKYYGNEACYIYSTPVKCHLLINFANSLDPDQAAGKTML